MRRSDIPISLTDVFQTMHDGLFLVRPDGTIITANDALLAMTGYTVEDLEGQACTIFRCEECDRYLGASAEHWCKLFQAGDEIRQPCHIYAKDGRRLEVLKSSRVARDEAGNIVAAVENVTDISDLVQAERRIEQLENLQGDNSFCGLIGESPVMRRLFAMIETAAQCDSSVIIHGESGTGKQLVADAIHRLGPRRDKPFVQVNCAAFNEHLLESELFGHVRGAFTGAHYQRTGRFEEVQGGDLFLDEVGDVPLPIQVKLLRVLENRQFERVGDNHQLALSARIISATHQDLEQLCAEGRFRRDFFFRINVVPLHVPPLRQRRRDIPLLVDHFVGRLRERTDRDVPGLTPDALARLMAYHWPGNVRELRSALEYAFVVCRSGPIDVDHLPHMEIRPPSAVVEAAPAPGPAPQPVAVGLAAPGDEDLTRAERAQRDELVEALRNSNGNKAAAARELGVSRMTIINRVRKYGIRMKSVLRAQG
jgi:two-component system response regulator HydG